MILAIYGAGGVGTDLQVLAKKMEMEGKAFWNQICYVDDNFPSSELDGIPVYVFQDFIAKYNNKEAKFAITVGEPAIRKMLYERVTEHGYALATLISPDITIVDSTSIGEGVIVFSGTYISGHVTIGKNTLVIPSAASIGHDDVIGNHCVIGAVTAIGGHTNIGDETYIASGCTLREGLHIGHNAIIGMGSYVAKDIGDQMVALGSPAREIRRNDNNRVFKKQ